jgi:hypothetical protein
MKRTALLLAATVAAVLSVGVAAAAAHGGPGPGGPGGPGPRGGASVSTLVTKAAAELGVTRAKLVSAIEASATAHIAQAEDDGDIPSDRADDLTAEVQDNLTAAYALSETASVAKELGITTTALNTAFKNVRKALAIAAIDKALADGRITAAEATDLKTKANAATYPGYKGGFGFRR